MTPEEAEAAARAAVLQSVAQVMRSYAAHGEAVWSPADLDRYANIVRARTELDEHEEWHCGHARCEEFEDRLEPYLRAAIAAIEEAR